MSLTWTMGLLHRSRIVPILMAGGVGLIAQLGVFELLAVWWQVTSYSVATVIGAEAGILINFLINDRVSFKHREQKLPLPSRLLRHQAVVLFAVLIQWLFVFTTEQFTKDFFIIHAALFAGIGVGLLWNMTWYHLFVWKRHSPES